MDDENKRRLHGLNRRTFLKGADVSWLPQLESYITGMKSIGGLGVFYWEPEVYSPFSSYNMGAWDATSREPTIALNGFLNA